MKQSRYSCNSDSVIGMQEMNVGVEEILQYCSALLSNQEIRHVITGLEKTIAELDQKTADTKERQPELAK